MHNYWLSQLFALVVAALFLGKTAHAQGQYVEPDFEKAIFDMNAVLLDDEERTRTADALAALASNFSANDGVSQQTRQMALAIALRVDPVNGYAWKANDRLREGRKPESVTRFPSPDLAVSALLQMAERLDDIDQGKHESALQCYLLDVARRVDSEDETIKAAFQLAAGGTSFPGWKGVIPDYHEDEFLFPPDAGTSGASDNGNSGDTTPLPPGTDLKGDEAAIYFPLLSASPLGGVPTAELATITSKASTSLREAGQPVRLLFPGSEGTADHPMDRRGAALIAALRNLHSEWPNNGRKIIVRFSSAYERINGRAGELPLALTLDSLFTGDGVSPKVAAVGMVDRDGTVVPVPQLMLRLRFASAEGVERLIIPAENADDLLDFIVLGKVEPLLKIQVFAVKTLADASSVAAETLDVKLQNAVYKFEELRDVALARDPAGTMRTDAVRGHLTEILDAAPNHLSAALLLRYATREVPERMTLQGSARELVSIIGPYRGVVTSTGAITDLGDAEQERVKATNRLTAVRGKLHADLVALADRIGEFTKEYETYSGLNSKTSRTGTEKKKYLIESWQAIRTQLGRVLSPKGDGSAAGNSTGASTGSSATSATGKWVRLFESSDPSFWNKESDGPGAFAVPCESAPDDMKYLRLTELSQGRSVIIALGKEGLLKLDRSSGQRYGWQGDNHDSYEARHLGVFDREGRADRSNDAPGITVDGGGSDKSGWGFGHRAGINDRQAWCWERAEIPETVFRIEVTAGTLDATERRSLLANS